METTKTYVFSNGVAVQYSPVSPFFVGKINGVVQRHFRDSQPIASVIETALGAAPDTANADYKAALNAWYIKVGYEVFARLVIMAVQLDADKQCEGQERAATLLAERVDEQARYAAMLAETGETADEPSDFERIAQTPSAQHPKMQYLLYVGAEGSQSQELIALLEVVKATNEVEAAVQTTAESFSGAVPGEVDLEILPAVVGA